MDMEIREFVVERQLDGGLHLLLHADCLQGTLKLLLDSLWVRVGV